MKLDNISISGCLLATLCLFWGTMLGGCGKSSENGSVQETWIFKKNRTVKLGVFNVESGGLAVSDPGYALISDVDPNSIRRVEKCLNGKWRAELVVKTFKTGSYGESDFQSELWVMHESISDPAKLTWSLESSDVGVDTGTAGIWDAGHFHDKNTVPKDMFWTSGETKGKPTPSVPRDLWVSWCYELVKAPNFADVMTFGAVSSSGRGDGGYPLFVARDTAGNAVAAKIVFIDDSGKG